MNLKKLLRMGDIGAYKRYVNIGFLAVAILLLWFTSNPHLIVKTVTMVTLERVTAIALAWTIYLLYIRQI